MSKFLKGSETIASNDGKTQFNKGGNKLESSDPVSGLMSTYFLGEVAAHLTGGTLNGSTYSYYILNIYIHHTFDTDYPNLTPLYEFWQDYQYAWGQVIEAMKMGSVVNQGSAGTWTEIATHQMYRSKLSTSLGSYIRFQWLVAWKSGTVQIPTQYVRLIPHIKFFNLPITISPSTGQGGGGGVILEEFNFYV